MEVSQNSSMIRLLFYGGAVLVVLLVWRVLKWVWLEPKRLERRLRKEGLRGNPYKFIHGDFKEIKAMIKEAYSKPLNLYHDDIIPRILPHVLQALNKHGTNTYLWFGPIPSVVIMDPNHVREVTQNTKIFQKARPNPLSRLVVSGVAGHEGDKWAKRRKLLNPAFHIDKLKIMTGALYESASEMMRKLEDIGCDKKGSFEVDVWPYLQSFTRDAISRTAFGSNYEEGKMIFELQREQIELLMEALREVYFPGLRFLPTKRNKRMKQIAREVDTRIGEIIDARVKLVVGGDERVNDNQDLLGLLLESMSQENGSDGTKNNFEDITIKDVIQECKLFYFAGQETTSVLLVWTLILLSSNQDWQSRARQEVLQVFGTNKPDFDGLNRLKIVHMILYEVLRLYPPISVLSRTSVGETRLGNLTLPAGVILTIPTILIHHHPNIWGDDAKEFKPERFAGGVSQATKGQVVFFPFGWGPRICIGQNFAMLEAKMALAMLLQRFSFQISPSYSHAPYQIVTLQPQYGAHLILHKL